MCPQNYLFCVFDYSDGFFDQRSEIGWSTEFHVLNDFVILSQDVSETETITGFLIKTTKVTSKNLTWFDSINSTGSYWKWEHFPVFGNYITESIRWNATVNIETLERFSQYFNNLVLIRIQLISKAPFKTNQILQELTFW